MKKTEFTAGHAPVVENVKLVERNPQDIELIFLDEGSTGIKNNGMSVRYTGGESVKIKFGKSKGLGKIVNGLASLFTTTSKKLYDPELLDKQIFTVNRAGFGYLARTLKRRLPQLKTGELGKLDMAGSANCDLHFTANSGVKRTVQISPGDSIFALEEKFGTLAYLVFKANESKLHSFSNLFTRTKTIELDVMESFTDFHLKLNASGLPNLFELYWAGKPIGRYEFSEAEPNTR